MCRLRPGGRLIAFSIILFKESPMFTHVFRSAGRALLAGCLAVPVAGVAAAPAWSAPASCAEVSPAAVSKFFDGAVPGPLARDRVPGAVVSVVSGSSTVFAKGY